MNRHSFDTACSRRQFLSRCAACAGCMAGGMLLGPGRARGGESAGGKLIWASGKTPHHWIPDRGFRKVRLRKGPNRLLFKIENAGGTMGFSIVLAVQPKT